MFDYDKFTIGSASVSTTATALGQNNAGTLTVGVNYRMRVSHLNMTNNGTAAGIMTIQKVAGTVTTVLLQQALAASQTVTLGEDQEILVDSGAYLQAVISAGTGAVFGTGEFVLE